MCLYGRSEGPAEDELARAAGLTVEELAPVYRDIDQKRRAALITRRATCCRAARIPDSPVQGQMELRGDSANPSGWN